MIKLLSRKKFAIWIYFLVASFAFLLVKALPAMAWKGIDYEEKTTIDIGPGNLVRTGKYIDFYDFRSDEIHNGKVLHMEETPAGTQLQVIDYDENRERTLIMDPS